MYVDEVRRKHSRSMFRVWMLLAGVAQLVEQLICNQQVVGSTPTASFKKCGGGRIRTSEG